MIFTKLGKKLLKAVVLVVGAVLSGGLILFVALFLKKRRKK